MNLEGFYCEAAGWILLWKGLLDFTVKTLVWFYCDVAGWKDMVEFYCENVVRFYFNAASWIFFYC